MQAPAPRSGAHISDPLLQPLTIGHLSLKNRIFSSAHASGTGDAGMPAERYQRYHEEKAKGGLALTMFGGSSNVSIDSPDIMPQLNMGTDKVIPHLEKFAQRIHAQGAAIMCQITHLGRRGEANKDQLLPTIAPSVVRETLHRSIPKEIDRHDIARVISDFARAAQRCRDAGLDGIETLAGAHLIGQFLSPQTNFRTDAYGGSLENRCRFGIEVFEAIRKAVGPRFLVGFRFVVDEGHAQGLSFDDCLAVARRFSDAGVLDFFNAIYGRMDTAAGLAIDNMPGMASPDAPWLSKAGAFKDAIDLPVFHAARIADVASARYAIREGLIDMVGMTRAHIADPHIVEKIARGDEARVRPCVGATHCMGHLRPTCLHNPATGHEAVLHQTIKPADHIRRVLVIGAGPAGLEAARVSALRGHAVTVLEAAPHPGGQLLLAAQASWRRNMAAIADWRVGELEALGVSIQCNKYVEAEDVFAHDADLVIIATGGIPNTGGLPGEDLITSPWDILSGTSAPAEDVLVIDGTGRHVALTAAEVVHSAGAKLHFVTIDEGLAQDQAYAERVIWRKWAREVRLVIDGDEMLTNVRRDGNRLVAGFINQLTNDASEISADQVIWDYGTRPADGLYHALAQASRNGGVTDLEALVAGQAQPHSKSPGFELHRIGDAVSSRNVHAAIIDALRLCQNC